MQYLFIYSNIELGTLCLVHLLSPKNDLLGYTPDLMDFSKHWPLLDFPFRNTVRFPPWEGLGSVLGWGGLWDSARTAALTLCEKRLNVIRKQ